LGITSGVKVTELTAGKLKTEGVQEGFIITRINDRPVNSADDVSLVLEDVKGGVYIEGVYPNGTVSYYAFGLNKTN
jgi:S1-C subfamily serine protease